MIYLDNAASSFPKPPEVIEAVVDCLTNVSASPGRGQHKMALTAGRIVMKTRQQTASLLGVDDPADIVFTANATEALNLAILGWVGPGDQVLTTQIEHNSVYRPLAALTERLGVVVKIARCDVRGIVDIDDWRSKLTAQTKLAIVAQASNVLAALQPLEDLIEAAKEARVPVLVDAAQSAGAMSLDIGRLGADMVAFTGHKALLGPQGTGGLYIDRAMDVSELQTGGTGGGSKGPQPRTRPDRYESGTYNTPGLAGLGAAVRHIERRTISGIYQDEQQRIQRLLEGLRRIEGVDIYGPAPGEPRASLVSINMRGRQPNELARLLDENYDIYARSGWLCAPMAHKLIGTYETGVLRLSPGYSSTDDEIDEVLAALTEIACL